MDLNDRMKKTHALKRLLSLLLCFAFLICVFSMDLPVSRAEDKDIQNDATDQQNADTEEENPDQTSDIDTDEDDQIADDENKYDEQPEVEFEEEQADTYEVETTEQPDPADYDAHNIIVKFKDNVSPRAMSSALETMGGTIDESDMGSLLLVDVPDDQDILGFVEELENLKNVEYAQPNYVYNPIRSVNDPYAKNGTQWYLNNISAFGAWDYTMGVSSIKIAVLDTGINTSHPEFSSQIVAAWNAVTGGTNVEDRHSHGTHVAGIAAAKANNSAGIAGIAPGAKLVIVDVFNGQSSAYTYDIIKGIEYAVANGARVINMSLGGYYYDQAFENAVNAAVASNVVVVAAAGNDGTSDYISPSDFENTISVIASNQSNTDANFSNYGASKDISAPGVDIYSTVLSGRYGYKDGTSMSSPIVAGVAALILSVNPNLTVGEVKNILYKTATDVKGNHNGFNYPVGWDQYTGHGIVNARAAVRMAARPKTTVARASANSIKISWSRIACASGYEIYQATASGGTYKKVGTVTSGSMTSWTHTNLTSGATYYYKVRSYVTLGSTKHYSNDSAVKSLFLELPSPAGLSTVPASFNSVKLAWRKVTGAGGYQVYRATSESGPYKAVYSGKANKFTDKSLTTGTIYYYKVRAFRKTGGKIVGGSFTAVQNARPVLSNAAGLKAKTAGFDNVKLFWRKVAGASGYEIHRADASGTYKLVASAKGTKFTDKALVPGTAYSYRVRAYRTAGGRRVYGGFTVVQTARPVLAKPGSIKTGSSSSNAAQISWGSVKGATGYQVYRSTSQSGTYDLVGTTAKRSFTDTTPSAGVVYYYKVRAYRTVGNATGYGPYSAAKSVRIK